MTYYIGPCGVLVPTVTVHLNLNLNLNTHQRTLVMEGRGFEMSMLNNIFVGSYNNQWKISPRSI